MGTVTVAHEPFAGWDDTYRVGNALVETRVVTELDAELRRAR